VNEFLEEIADGRLLAWAERPEPVAPLAPKPVARPVTLGGIDWTGVEAEATGLVALIDVAAGEGERQGWF